MAHSWVGLLTISHMMGKTQPGGFHHGLAKLAYQSGSPRTLLGFSAWLVAADMPPSTMAPTKLDPNTTKKEARSSTRGSPNTDGTHEGYESDAANLTLDQRIPNRAADSKIEVVPIFAKRTGFESLQAPPRGIVSRALMMLLLLLLERKARVRGRLVFFVETAFVETEAEAACLARIPWALRSEARQRNLKIVNFIVCVVCCE